MNKLKVVNIVGGNILNYQNITSIIINKQEIKNILFLNLEKKEIMKVLE